MGDETLGPVPQAGLSEMAERCLRCDSHLALNNISCDYQDGVLILRGRLPTYYLKQLAQQVVSQVGEVKRIDNQIEVVAPPSGPRRG